MPNVPPWPALMVSRGITKRTKLTVESTVGTVTDHPACVKGLYSALGIDAGAPLNSLATYDDLGNLLAFESEQFDGTNLAVHWKDSYVSADADRYLYWDPTVDPGSSLADPTAVWSNGFAAVYHMGDAGPTNVLDSLGVNNGVQSGGVTFGQTGQIGKCCQFDGTDDRVTCGDITQLKGVSQFSVSGWFNRSSLQTGYAASWGKWPNDANGLQCYYYGILNWWYMMIGNGSDYGYVRLSTAWPADAWTHIGIVYDGTQSAQADRIRCYANGVWIAPDVVGGTIPATSPISTKPFTIGDVTDSTTMPGNLLADEVRVVSSALSQPHLAAETLFGLGTAVTVGAVETYQPPGGLPLILGRAGRSGPSLAGLRC